MAQQQHDLAQENFAETWLEHKFSASPYNSGPRFRGLHRLAMSEMPADLEIFAEFLLSEVEEATGTLMTNLKLKAQL